MTSQLFAKFKFFPFYLAVVAFAGLAGCAQSAVKDEARQPANMGGSNYNQGTFACADPENQLAATFTFGESTASFTLRGESVALECEPANGADLKMQSLFKKEYKSFADICSGRSSKGQVVAGTSNAMGNVQMTAFLVAKDATKRALLNCQSAQKPDANHW